MKTFPSLSRRGDPEQTQNLDPAPGGRSYPGDTRTGDNRTIEVGGPRPRASLLCTVGLVLGVLAVAAALTGTLAGYGIGVGAAGAVLAALGLIAARRRHVTGRTDALIGMVTGLAAVVLGVIALSGQYDWPTTDGDWVQRFRDWLDSQVLDRI